MKKFILLITFNSLQSNFVKNCLKIAQIALFSFNTKMKIFHLIKFLLQMQTVFVAHFQSVFLIQNLFVENAFVNDISCLFYFTLFCTCLLNRFLKNLDFFICICIFKMFCVFFLSSSLSSRSSSSLNQSL